MACRAQNFIGGSEASAILGLNPYKSNTEIWQEKDRQDYSQRILVIKPYVKYGIEAEQYLTALFALDHPRYEVKRKYQLYGLQASPISIYSPEPWTGTGRKGNWSQRSFGDQDVNS